MSKIPFKTIQLIKKMNNVLEEEKISKKFLEEKKQNKKIKRFKKELNRIDKIEQNNNLSKDKLQQQSITDRLPIDS